MLHVPSPFITINMYDHLRGQTIVIPVIPVIPSLAKTVSLRMGREIAPEELEAMITMVDMSPGSMIG